MTPDEIRELRALQEGERLGDLGLADTARLHRLRTKLALQPEYADDPATPFVDEARRPQLDGTDYLGEQRRRDCEEITAAAGRFAVKYGAEFALAILTGALKR